MPCIPETVPVSECSGDGGDIARRFHLPTAFQSSADRQRGGGVFFGDASSAGFDRDRIVSLGMLDHKGDAQPIRDNDASMKAAYTLIRHVRCGCF